MKIFIVLIVVAVVWFFGGFYLYRYSLAHPETQHSVFDMSSAKHKRQILNGTRH